MKMKVKHICVIAALALICAAPGSFGQEAGVVSLPDYAWGEQPAKIKSAIDPGKCVEFKPSEKPEYRNEILSYITAIDADLEEKIRIVRLQSRPVVDYLFVNGKLYTVMEDWGQVNLSVEKEIRARLSGRFGEPVVQKDKNLHIYSYNNDTTKVLCYLTKLPEGPTQCKVYYYTKRLFRMLITE